MWVTLTIRSSNAPLRHRIIPIPSPSHDILGGLGLFWVDHILAYDNCYSRAAQDATRGSKEHMSSKEMYHHLNRIQEFVPQESRSHFQIETIAFRALAMLQGDERMIFKPEDGSRPLEVPILKRLGTQKLSGVTGYNLGAADNIEEGSLSKFRPGTQLKPG